MKKVICFIISLFIFSINLYAVSNVNYKIDDYIKAIKTTSTIMSISSNILHYSYKTFISV